MPQFLSQCLLALENQTFGWCYSISGDIVCCHLVWLQLSQRNSHADAGETVNGCSESEGRNGPHRMDCDDVLELTQAWADNASVNSSDEELLKVRKYIIYRDSWRKWYILWLMHHNLHKQDHFYIFWRDRAQILQNLFVNYLRRICNHDTPHCVRFAKFLPILLVLYANAMSFA